MHPVRSSAATARRSLPPDRGIEPGNSVITRNRELERTPQARLLVPDRTRRRTRHPLRDSSSIDQLQTPQLIVEEGGAPRRLMTNVDAESVSVNAHRGVRRDGHMEPTERRPEQRRGRQEVAHPFLPTLQTV